MLTVVVPRLAKQNLPRYLFEETFETNCISFVLLSGDLRHLILPDDWLT